MRKVRGRVIGGIVSGLAAAFALLAVPAAGQAPSPLDATTQRAVQAFAQVCLANAGSLEAARSAAMAAPWSFERQEDLPSLVHGAPMQTFVSGEVEMVLRPDRKGAFGCLVMFKMPDATGAEQLRDAVSATPGLTLTKPGGAGKALRAEWRSAMAPAGSKVLLTVYDMKPRAPILSLESKGNPN